MGNSAFQFLIKIEDKKWFDSLKNTILKNKKKSLRNFLIYIAVTNHVKKNAFKD